MALARIITRSQACSRELALDLLARGYAVEIVAPDKVLDNIADLELRVDVGPGDQLIANVEAHDGQRAASLEFVHHLKAPMVDFMRRPPQLGEAVHFSGEPVSFNAAPGIVDTELPAEVPQLAPRAVSRATEILLNREFDPGIDPDEGARLIAARVLSPPPEEPPGSFAVEDAAVPQPTMAQPTIVPPTQAAQRRDRSVGWPWRAALTFASVVLLAVLLAFSMRRTSKAAAQSSETLPVEKIAAESTGVNPLSAVDAEKDAARDPGQVSAAPLPPPAVASEENSSHARKEAQVTKVGAPTASPRTAVSRQRGDDLIARDTVTYLDKRLEPAPKAKRLKPLARRHPKSHTHGGVIAANTVTYLNRPAPKAAK
ncbi:MAG: hypothetical protein WCC78_15460 [Terriglobales bacterium]